MKKISFVLTAALAVVACQKNDVVVNDVLVSIPVTVEPMNTPTKASVVVDGTKFTPSLTDGDVFAVMSSYIGATATKKFTYSITDGTITGNLPTFDTDKERYIVVSSAVSSTGGISGIGANDNNWRIIIDAEQNNTEGEFGNDLLLVAVTDECESGVSPETIEFKTMCSLLEFDITNGVSDKTYLESITVEAIGGEQIAGKFALAKTYSDNWMKSYTVDSNIKAKDKSSSITLDCGKTELTATSTPFYVACAFGTLSQGLKVTFTVSHENGASSTITKTIGKAGITLERNTLYKVATTISAKADAVKGPYTVTYTVKSTSNVTTSGTAPTGSTVTFKNTYSTANQMIKNKSQTYTLSGYNGKTIKKVVLSMKSNQKSGKGTFSLTAGSTSLASISTATAFNSWFDSNAYSTTYKDVTVTLTNDKYEIQSGENVVLVIAATENSLYCQSVTITYE